MKKIIAVLSVIAFALVTLGLTACGGGGGTTSSNASATPPITGTAAQYFTKKAAGNQWSFLQTSVDTAADGSVSTTSVVIDKANIEYVNGVVTQSSSYTMNGTTYQGNTYKMYIDSNGAWVSQSASTVTGYNELILPATFSVGTTWTAIPADATNGLSAAIAVVDAFNVTRRVPAGTFTDCLQVSLTQTMTNSAGSYSIKVTYYYSPTAGNTVEERGLLTVSTSTGQKSTSDIINQLQRYNAL